MCYNILTTLQKEVNLMRDMWDDEHDLYDDGWYDSDDADSDLAAEMTLDAEWREAFFNADIEYTYTGWETLEDWEWQNDEIREQWLARQYDFGDADF
jgi:hypothetical protein